MSLDLADIKRLKITERTVAWLDAKVRTNPKLTRQEILRDILDKLAAEEIHAARILVALAPDDGHSGDSRGRGSK